MAHGRLDKKTEIQIIQINNSKMNLLLCAFGTMLELFAMIAATLSTVRIMAQ